MLSWKFLEKQAHFNKVEGQTLTFLNLNFPDNLQKNYTP